MNTPLLVDKADAYLKNLCVAIPSRCVGSPGNHAATAFFAGVAASFGFSVETPTFDCMEWGQEGAQLRVGDEPFVVHTSPYSLSVEARGLLYVVNSVEELADARCAGAILLLRGPIAAEQLMPKNFPFYNPDHHQRIVGLLEAKQPRAIVTATSRDVTMAGAIYPFPLIEDGDFAIPSVYMTEEEGERLAALAGQEAQLTINAWRRPATGCNVIARKGGHGQRVVICAHIDAKQGTPGAIDNAGGTTVLLLLAELLADYEGALGIELVAINGEDYYSSPGEQLYLARNAGSFDSILLGINLDGVGYRRGHSAYSLYEFPDELAGLVREIFANHHELAEGNPWYQGDHMLFLINQRPALAITTEQVMEVMARFVHSADDRPELVDSRKLVAVAIALRDLVLRLAKPQRSSVIGGFE